MNAATACGCDAIDELVRAVVPGGGAGWHEQQSAARYAPAVEHPHDVLQQVLHRARQAGPLRTVLEVGAGRFGVRHHALRTIAERVVTVEADGERLQRLAAIADVAGRADAVVHGRASDPAVRDELRRLADGCDLLLLDGSDHYAGMAADWRAVAGLVRPGGLVAIVDRSQAWPEPDRTDGVDRFVADLAEHHLHPRGRRLCRHGRGHGIASYVRAADDDEASARWPEPPAHAPAVREPERLHGFVVGRDGATWFAVRDAAPTLGVCAVRRHDHELAFLFADRDPLEHHLALWRHVERTTDAGLLALAAGDRQALAAAAAEARQLASLRPWLVAALQDTPRAVTLLRAAGTLWILLDDLDTGAALLRSAVDLDFADVRALQALHFVEGQLRGDAAAASELVATTRQRVADRERMRICMQELRGHAVWTQPRLLRGRRRMTWIGSGGEAGLHGGERLGMRCLWLPNGAAVPTTLAADARVLGDLVVGDGDPCTMFGDPRDGAIAQRPWAPGYARQQPAPQRALGTVATTTLDTVLQQGRLCTDDLEVLVLDVQGPLLAILQGAERALQSVQSLCVRVQHQSVFAGSVPHPELLGWLRDRGLHLLGCEPCADPAAAFALLERPRA